RRVKVVVDCGNGVASLVAVETLRELGADVVPLFCTSDGTFPNHHPDPTVLENLHDLQAAVRREGAELGIAFDGDGDRIGAVDEQGRAVLGDLLLVLLGRDLARRMGPGHPVILDVKCSEVPSRRWTASASPSKTGGVSCARPTRSRCSCFGSRRRAPRRSPPTGRRSKAGWAPRAIAREASRPSLGAADRRRIAGGGTRGRT